MAQKPSERLRQLREDGYKVKVSHLRRPTSPLTVVDSGETLRVELATLRALRGYGAVPSPKGGETRVSILNGEDKPLALGVARCSLADTFNRRLGLAIALGRAEKTLANVPGDS